jgi:Asparagine synthase
MAGFCLEIRAREAPEAVPPLRPVDLGGAATEQSFTWGAVRLAWSFRRESLQWWTREQPGRLLLIEGHPDRYPAPHESLDEWLGGRRWGSFRGLEVFHPEQGAEPSGATAFVDPLGTRPLYVHRAPDRLLISDKLSTIAIHSGVEVNWPAVLESMTLGSLYSCDTTLCDVDELSPGERIEFRGVELLRTTRSQQPADGDIDRRRVRGNPAGALLAAMRKAVAETWSDPEVSLLLSGGLDSRLVLALAGPGRKAVTLDLYDEETGIARQVAACCGAELRAFPHRDADLLSPAQLAVAAGGAMHDAHFFNHLGFGAKWRSDGVAAVAHAYLFDTLLKGYFLLPAGGFSHSVLARCMPATARFFERISGRGSPFAPDDVIALLTARGREVLEARLSALEATFQAESSDGLDLTFEKRVLERISRQIHYGTFLGWCEELDVVSPIFHPALWSWHKHSRARDRVNGRAFVQALLSLDHEAVRVVDSNTGAPPRLPARSWRDVVRDSSFYQRFLQPFRRSLAASPGEVTFPSGLGERFRRPDALRFLAASIDGLRGHEWFDEAAIEGNLAKFAAGQERYLEPLLACASAGRWQQIVRDKVIGP